MRPGRYPLESWFYLRKWFVDQLMDISLDLLGPLYATLYLAPWYRLLGAKVGKNAEISTACATSPDLLTLGDGSFIADCVSLGVARVEQGTITIAPTCIGAKAFVGNSALVPGGTVIGDDALIGVLSSVPQTTPGRGTAVDVVARLAGHLSAATAGQHPLLGRKHLSADPPVLLLRALIEFFRIILPITCFVVLTCLLMAGLLRCVSSIRRRSGASVSAALRRVRHCGGDDRRAGEVGFQGIDRSGASCRLRPPTSLARHGARRPSMARATASFGSTSTTKTSARCSTC